MIERHGDLVSPGRYRCHSRFARAANYACDDRLVSLVSPELGAGPLSLVVDAREVGDVEFVTITEEGVVFLDDARHELDPSARYDSRIAPGATATLDALSDDVAATSAFVARAAHPRSWAFLLAADPGPEPESSFERTLRARVRARVAALCERRSAAALCRLRGLGLGLTPSGDDFVCGHLHAQHLRARLGGRRFDPDRLPTALFAGGDLLTRSLLRCAAAGRVAEPVGALLALLGTRPGAGALHRAIERVLDCGETSGADWATGLCVGLAAEPARLAESWRRAQIGENVTAELPG